MAQMTFVEGKGDRPAGRPRGRTTLWASVAGAAVGIPLVGMTGFTLTASLLLLLVASPLLLVSSPLLLVAALIVTASMAGFAASMAMAIGGLAALACAARALGFSFHGPVGRFIETLTESGQRMKSQTVDVGDYFQKKVLVQPPEVGVNHG